MRIHLMLFSVLASAALTGAAPLDKFTYTVPPQAYAYPALRAWFAGEEKRLRSAAAIQAAGGQRDAAAAGQPFHPFETSRDWKVVTDLPQFLSLSEQRYDYTDGAHGNTSYAAQVWDKSAKLRRSPFDFFVSADALSQVVKPAFCQKLDARRNAPGEPEYSPCPDPGKEVVILGSTTGRKFDRIGFLIPPYEAGPYAQGSFDITLPVTTDIIAIVRPEYRRYFAPGSN